jgi:hypothetical protein
MRGPLPLRLAGLLSLLLAAGLPSAAEKQRPQDNGVQNLPIILSMRIARFSCGEDRISIETIQRQVDLYTGEALLQVVGFTSKDGKAKMYYLQYDNSYPGPDSMIIRAKCITNEAGNFVWLLSENYGSCDGCEWSDFYTPDGTYLGSQKNGTEFGAVGFGYHPLPERYQSLFADLPMSREGWLAEIDRTFP